MTSSIESACGNPHLSFQTTAINHLYNSSTTWTTPKKTAPRFCKERCKIPQVPKAKSCAPGCLARHCRVWVLGLVLFHNKARDSHDTCNIVSLLMEELPQTTYSWIPFFNLPPRKKDQKILCIESTATTWNRCSKTHHPRVTLEATVKFRGSVQLGNWANWLANLAMKSRPRDQGYSVISYK